MTKKSAFYTDAQLKDEIAKCEYCAEKPCMHACPCHCSPTDFIMAAAKGQPSDLKRAALKILSSNPMGEVCGVVCPDSHCMAACVHKGFGTAVNIPKIQASIVHKARQLGVLPKPTAPASTGKKIAVIGGGPAGYGAAVTLAQLGHAVEIFEEESKAGGACLQIPVERLP